jgi:hypothetical protein
MARNPKSAAADDSLDLPQSTGAVETPTGPEEYSQAADNTSTDAVETPGALTVEQGYLNDPVTVNYETPSKPVTVTAGFLSNAQRKVIEAEHARSTGVPSDVTPETKDAEGTEEA